jgi:beta-phosphoglucomutase-like phosphatase (HAD superfamily)
VRPDETMVVEDSFKGFEAAVRAGCHVLKVDNPTFTTEENIFSRIVELEAPVL